MRNRSKQLSSFNTEPNSSSNLLFKATGISVAIHLLFSLAIGPIEEPEPKVVKEGYLVSLVSAPNAASVPTPQPEENIRESRPLKSEPPKIDKAKSPSSTKAPPTKSDNPKKSVKKKSNTGSTETKSSKPSKVASPTKPKQKTSEIQNKTAAISNKQKEPKISPKELKSSISETVINKDIKESANSSTQQTAVTEQATVSDQVENTIQAKSDPSITPPKYTLGSNNNPQPNYPRLARKQGQQGDVVLGVHVKPDGTIRYLEILKGAEFSTLNFAAWSTVKDSWVFEPAMKDEIAVDGFVEVVISFRSENR